MGDNPGNKVIHRNKFINWETSQYLLFESENNEILILIVDNPINNCLL